MGKKSKRHSDKAARSRDDSSRTARVDFLDRVTARLAALPAEDRPSDEYEALMGCATNAELLERVRILRKIESHPRPPPGWQPQTPADWRQVMDDFMDSFEMARLVQNKEGEDPTQNEMQLAAFRDYTVNFILNVCGHTNQKYTENFRLAGVNVDAAPEPLVPFPDASPAATLWEVTSRDKQFLQQILQNYQDNNNNSDGNNSPPIYPAHAALALGFLYKFWKLNPEKGYFHFQESVRICNSVSDAQKKQPLPGIHPLRLIDGTTLSFSTVGDYVTYIWERANKQVKVGRKVHDTFLPSDTASGPSPDNSGPTSGSSSSCLPGEQCEGCGKKAAPDEKLLVCTRCRRAYYCGKACQIAHWKQPAHDGHKHSCRKKGEFKKGDQVKTLQRFGITPAGTTVVLLEEQQQQQQPDVQNSIKKWLVVSLYDDDKCVLSEDQLRVIPPSEKRFQDAVDKQIFGGRTFLGGGDWEIDLKDLS